jgi:hypothetical protein
MEFYIFREVQRHSSYLNLESDIRWWAWYVNSLFRCPDFVSISSSLLGTHRERGKEKSAVCTEIDRRSLLMGLALTCRASSGSKSGVARSRRCRGVSDCDVVSRLRCHMWLPHSAWYTSCAWYLKSKRGRNGCSISDGLRRMRRANGKPQVTQRWVAPWRCVCFKCESQAWLRKRMSVHVVQIKKNHPVDFFKIKTKGRDMKLIRGCLFRKCRYRTLFYK